MVFDGVFVHITQLQGAYPYFQCTYYIYSKQDGKKYDKIYTMSLHKKWHILPYPFSTWDISKNVTSKMNFSENWIQREIFPHQTVVISQLDYSNHFSVVVWQGLKDFVFYSDKCFFLEIDTLLLVKTSYTFH